MMRLSSVPSGSPGGPGQGRGWLSASTEHGGRGQQEREGELACHDRAGVPGSLLTSGRKYVYPVATPPGHTDTRWISSNWGVM